MNTLQQKIESLLFYKNEPVSFSWLAGKIGVQKNDIISSVEGMLDFYENRGLTLVLSDDKVSLLTSENTNDLISSIAKDTEERELSKQALETLAIILYKGKIAKQELDYIRGVNSVFILRNLLIRGLIEKKSNPEDKRSFMYSVTHDTLAFLGIQKVSDLPQFDEFSKKITDLENDWKKENDAENNQEDLLKNDNTQI